MTYHSYKRKFRCELAHAREFFLQTNTIVPLKVSPVCAIHVCASPLTQRAFRSMFQHLANACAMTNNWAKPQNGSSFAPCLDDPESLSCLVADCLSSQDAVLRMFRAIVGNYGLVASANGFTT